MQIEVVLPAVNCDSVTVAGLI